MAKHKLRVMSYKFRVSSCDVKHDLKFKSASSKPRVQIHELRVKSWNLRVASLNPRVTSLNLRV